MHGQFSLQLGDGSFRRAELGMLGAAQPWLQALVDAVLLAPHVDRLSADPQVPCDVDDRSPGLEQVQHFAAGTPADTHACPPRPSSEAPVATIPATQLRRSRAGTPPRYGRLFVCWNTSPCVCPSR